jgi:hypothetical protein
VQIHVLSVLDESASHFYYLVYHVPPEIYVENMKFRKLILFFFLMLILISFGHIPLLLSLSSILVFTFHLEGARIA